MNTSPPPQPSDPTAPQEAEAFARLLDIILGSPLRVIAAHAAILVGRTAPVWNRISRTRLRLARLLARIAAGTYPPLRTRAPRPRAPARPAGHPESPPPAWLSRGRLWLVARIGHQAAGHGAQLQFLLDQPQTRAALDAAPPHALAAVARTLRPLCRTLGVTLPPQLQSPPRPAQPRPHRPRRQRRRRPQPRRQQPPHRRRPPRRRRPLAPRRRRPPP